MSIPPSEDALAYYLRPLKAAGRWLRSWVLRTPLRAFATAVLVLAVGHYFLTEALGDRQRVVQLLDAVFVAVIAAGCLSALGRYYSHERKAYPLQKWLGFNKNEKTLIAVTSVLQESRPEYGSQPYVLVPPFDAQAAGVLTDVVRSAGLRYPMRQTIGAHLIDRSLLAHNVVAMCMPSHNPYSRVFLGLFNEIYAQRRDPLEVTERWRDYLHDATCRRRYLGLHREINAEGRPSWGILDLGDDSPNNWKTSSLNRAGLRSASRPGQIHYDYGMILKGPNPFDNRCGVLIACGIHGMGTLGAALFLYKNQEDLFVPFSWRAQFHLVRVGYCVPERGSLVDAEITRVSLESSVNLDRGLDGRLRFPDPPEIPDLDPMDDLERAAGRLTPEPPPF